MEIFLDTIDFELIKEAKSFNIYGITTNPTILSKTIHSPRRTIETLLSIQEGPVAVQVTENSSEKIIAQAKHLSLISDRLILKIPTTKEGLKAINFLKKEKINILATVIYTPTQALFAYLAKADYIAPYVSRIDDFTKNGNQSLISMKQIKSNYQFPTKILAASIRSMDQIHFCLENAIDSITLQEKVFLQWVEDYPKTLENLVTFSKDWEKVKQDDLSSL